MRHKAAGFTKYQWTTSGDERVREEHVDLDGNIYRYDEPTDEQDGLQPGQPINCRCLAEPIFDGLNDE
jgi:SPP1 gp7 family putative phage head morphogenesis protein